MGCTESEKRTHLTLMCVSYYILLNRKNLLHEPILFVLFSGQRYAEQMLACIHADNFINYPTL
jgi:hypothetical protein